MNMFITECCVYEIYISCGNYSGPLVFIMGCVYGWMRIMSIFCLCTFFLLLINITNGT